jgi:hypothetical protein
MPVQVPRRGSDDAHPTVSGGSLPPSGKLALPSMEVTPGGLVGRSLNLELRSRFRATPVLEGSAVARRLRLKGYFAAHPPSTSRLTP